MIAHARWHANYFLTIWIILEPRKVIEKFNVCLWIVCRRPVSCVSNTADVSGLFVFVLCLVCPILAMSLDCFSSSCVLCPPRWQSLWIVFVLCLVYPTLTVSLYTWGAQDRGRRQSRETVNVGYTRHRTKTNNLETLSTWSTQDTGRRQTIQRHCQRGVDKTPCPFYLFKTACVL
jgi:hypothetical protein